MGLSGHRMAQPVRPGPARAPGTAAMRVDIVAMAIGPCAGLPRHPGHAPGCGVGASKEGPVEGGCGSAMVGCRFKVEGRAVRAWAGTWTAGLSAGRRGGAPVGPGRRSGAGWCRMASALGLRLLAREAGFQLALGGAVGTRPGLGGVADAGAASVSVQAGLARCGRATAHRSARPAAMMLLTWSASLMAPTAMVAMPASCRTRSANGVWNMRPYTGFSRLLTWPELQSIRSAPAALKARAISTASSGVMPPGHPVVGRDAHAHRPLGRPGRTHGRKHGQRITQAVVQAATVRVGAVVGQRRDEARQQVAVGAVQLQPVEAGGGGAAGGGDEDSASTRSMSACVMAWETWLMPSRYCCGEALISGQLASLSSSGSGWSVPSQPRRVDPLAPAWPICMANLASLLACTQSTMRCQAAPCSSVHRPGQPGVMRASGLVQVISANTRPRAAHGACAQVHQVVVARPCRPRPSTGPSATPPPGSSASAHAACRA